MNKEMFTGILRHGLQAIGVYVLAKGWFDAAVWDTVVGGALAVVPVLWSMWIKKEAVA